MPGESVAEIHAYPLRPPGFQETLFSMRSSRRSGMEHLLEAPWLMRASELGELHGQSAHVVEEPISLKACRGWVEVVRSGKSGRRCWRKRRVVRVIERWREVRGWWDRKRHVDRLFLRVLLSGGEVVDLARERSGGWTLVGIVD